MRYLALLLLLLALGCNRPSGTEPTYKGLPLSAYLTLARDRDGETRSQAFMDLANFGNRPDVVAALRRGTQDDQLFTRGAAAQSLFDVTGESGPYVAYCRQLFSDGGTHASMAVTDAGRLGKAAAPLRRELTAHLATLNDDNDLNSWDRDRIRRILSDLPPD